MNIVETKFTNRICPVCLLSFHLHSLWVIVIGETNAKREERMLLQSTLKEIVAIYRLSLKIFGIEDFVAAGDRTARSSLWNTSESLNSECVNVEREAELRWSLQISRKSEIPMHFRSHGAFPEIERRVSVTRQR